MPTTTVAWHSVIKLCHEGFDAAELIARVFHKRFLKSLSINTMKTCFLLAHGMGSSVDTMLNVHWSSYWPLLEQTRMLHALARFVTLHHESRRLVQI